MLLGSNANGVRRYNERLMLSIIRRRDGASKSDLAKATGLSPQAAVRIVEDLEASGLLVQSGKRKGGMGQPATIYKINGDNGYTIGVEIGRTRLVCALLNFNGDVLAIQSTRVNFPDPQAVLQQIKAFSAEALGMMSARQQESFVGYGIAMPWFIGEWRNEIGLTSEQGRAWEDPDLENFFKSSLNAPVMFENDGNSAALAEMLCGEGAGIDNFLYFHIGTFVGGGLVLRGQLEEGRNGNAAALASMPVPSGTGAGRVLLLHRASLYQFEQAEHANELVVPGSWLDECADALAFAIVGANSLLDLDAIVIGGALTTPVLQSLLANIDNRIDDDCPPDFFKPRIVQGHIGADAAAIGAGLLPLHATYSPNLKSLFKSKKA